jgi:hypothetical protein
MNKEEYKDLESRINALQTEKGSLVSAAMKEACKDGTCLIGPLDGEEDTVVIFQKGDSFGLALETGETEKLVSKVIPIEYKTEEDGHKSVIRKQAEESGKETE